MKARFGIALAAAVAVVLVLGVSAGKSFAAKGQCSIGGNFAAGIYSNKDLNDILKANTPPRKEVKSGWEYGGSFRYNLSNKLALDVEANAIKASATTSDPAGDGDEKWRVQGLAVPVNLYYALSTNDSYAFNIFAGAGPMLSSKLHASDNSDDVKTDSKTVFYGQGGLEGQVLVSPKFAITARALGRIAKIKDPELAGTPLGIDLDLSGAAFGLGLRLMFGGGQ
jgi:hypothetical protein